MESQFSWVSCALVGERLAQVPWIQVLPEISTSLSPLLMSSTARSSVVLRSTRSAALEVLPHVSQITAGGGPRRSTIFRIFGHDDSVGEPGGGVGVFVLRVAQAEVPD